MMAEYIVESNESGSIPFTSNGVRTKEEIIRCRDCKHYIPEEEWQENRGNGFYEINGEPPSCNHWGHLVREADGTLTNYRPDVDPDGFCAWAERSE